MGQFHDYLWGTPTPRFTMKDSTCISPTALFYYRLLAFFIQTFVFFWTFILDGGLVLLKYMTLWGVTWVYLYFIGVLLCYRLYRVEEHVNHKNPLAFWKFVNVIFELAFSLQVLIPLFYWLILFPGLTEEHHGIKLQKTICVHFVSGLLVWIEICINKVNFYIRHVFILLGFLLFYAVLNFIVTQAEGYPIYSVVTWKDFGTYLYLTLAALVATLGFCLGLFLTRKKNKKADLTSSILSESFY